jgi:hypothetical protein
MLLLSLVRCLGLVCGQPTKNLTNGRVLRKRKTSSLARLNHFCVRNTQLELVNGALQTVTGDELTLTELFVLAEGLDMFRLLLLVGG